MFICGQNNYYNQFNYNKKMDEREELRFKKELQDKLAKEYERYLVVDKL